MARMTQEERFMREAIRLAKKAASLKEVPIGCVIVHDGKIIGTCRNCSNSKGLPCSRRLAFGRVYDVRDAGALSDVCGCDCAGQNP